MFIGHLPAGYLVSHVLIKVIKIKPGSKSYRRLIWTGLIASVIPDFDLLYFYLIDNRQTLHHHYFTHAPYFWVCFFIFTILIAAMSRSRIMYAGSLFILANTIMHLVLNTIVGKIRWGWPFFREDTVLFTVPAVYDWWVWNFVLHWTFLFEVAVVLLATLVFLASTRTGASDKVYNRLIRNVEKSIC